MSGCLIPIVGPSGVGKDSLLDRARQRLAGDPAMRFVQRWITRPAQAGGEDHRALSEASFLRRLAAGDFALHWDSHGLRYGIDREIDDWLARGCTVLFNASRAHLAIAHAGYPTLRAISVVARPETLAQRLVQRRRECSQDIAARIARSPPPFPPYLPVIEVANDGSIESAAEVFLAAIDAHRLAAASTVRHPRRRQMK
ncbi:MAG: phosphonate metabolism protein/1,5-bisphosphokinase (PRPP-forming) PhnN [Burkholderiaceae bacterium]|nr:phosphonate metabolism protein/1,5-bisphosphokinase (PRPP-forming) PhnN [Sulfuritalea sp.]MCF8173691.1 phosphonate metabolism protein/1,5-bisphosphokinase (PRPP-forming) PhnN [Burkholderiaceae bacterium]